MATKSVAKGSRRSARRQPGNASKAIRKTTSAGSTGNVARGGGSSSRMMSGTPGGSSNAMKSGTP